MKERRKLMGLAIAVTLAAAGSVGAQAPNKALVVAKEPPLTQQRYEDRKKRIEAQSRADRKACRRLEGERRDVCEAQARGKEDAAKAKLEARFRGTPEATLRAKEVTAEANYKVAREKCALLEGKTEDRCMDEAKAAREAALRQARVEKVESTGGIYGRKDSDSGG